MGLPTQTIADCRERLNWREGPLRLSCTWNRWYCPKQLSLSRGTL